MNLKMLLRFNWVLFASMLALLACGTVAIWSAGNAREAIFHGMWMNHLFTALIGLVLYFLLALTDYRIVIRFVSPVAYAVSLVLLIAVLAFGSTVYGGRRWLWFFQPSEIAKFARSCFSPECGRGRTRSKFRSRACVRLRHSRWPRPCPPHLYCWNPTSERRSRSFRPPLRCSWRETWGEKAC